MYNVEPINLAFEDTNLLPDAATSTSASIDTTLDLKTDDIFGGIDLGSIGTIASVVGSLFAAKEDSKYKKELLKREDVRIERERTRQDNFESGMNEAWK